MVRANRSRVQGMKGIAALLAVPAVLAQEPALRRRLGFGTFTADASNPTVSSTGTGASPLLGSIAPSQTQLVSQESGDLMAAMIQSFLNKQHLDKGELDCITEGSGELGGKVGSLTSQMQLILKQAFGPAIPDLPVLPDASATPASPQAGGVDDAAGSISDMVDQINAQKAIVPATAAGSGAAAQAAAAGASPAGAQEQSDPSLSFFYNGRRLQQGGSPSEAGINGMSAFPVAMELGLNMQAIVKNTHSLVGKCMHPDAMRAFQQAGTHMRNLTYMTGHFLANGADIVSELADSVMGYEKHNVTQIGSDFGKALRKVFLSNSTNGELPEGMPGNRELANVTAGLLRGFFGEGTFMDVKSKKDPNVPVHVDMHDCVKDNTKFFQQIWAAAMYLFAQKATEMDPHGKSSLDTGAGKIQFGTTLAFTMMELPTALRKCDISPEQEDMIMDAVKSMGRGTNVKFRLPNDAPSKDDLTNSFAQTVKDWSANDWETFGKDLGQLMQGAVVHYFPKKYSLEDGFLRRHWAANQDFSPGLSLYIPLFFTFVLALMAVKHRRHFSTWQQREWCIAESAKYEVAEDSTCLLPS